MLVNRALSLPSLNMNGSIPQAITALRSITYLDLSNNQLQSTIPAGLTVLTALRYLNLAGNRLSGGLPTWAGVVMDQSNTTDSVSNATGRVLRLDAYVPKGRVRVV